MIKSIQELNFDKDMQDFIKDAERGFNMVAKSEGSEQSLLEWINSNIDALEEESFMKNLTDREGFLLAFGMLTTYLEERLSY